MKCFRQLPVFVLILLCVIGRSESGETGRVKAVWVTRWGFESKSDLRDLFENLEPLGINMVFFQARGACDALYRSAYEPWSAVLTDTLGVYPGWDPLGAAIEEGHARGMEVHAWINVFSAWPVSDEGSPPPKTVPSHVMRVHPNWIAVDRDGEPMSLLKSETRYNYAFLSPTHPSAQQHVEDVVTDLVGRYEIDGLHLDHVRFPDSSFSYDSRSKAGYISALRDTQITYADWRRENLSEFVGRLADAARTSRPGVAVSAAVWQKIEAGRQYHFQDGIEWVTRGYVDFLVPMIYTVSLEAFEERLSAYSALAGPERVIAGMGPYLEGFTDSIFSEQLEAIRESGVRGVAIFNSDYALTYSSLVEAYEPAVQEQ
ncbi:MAG: family 10 glycosylhydrolase [Candidatus Eisenbacteria bacterium]